MFFKNKRGGGVASLKKNYKFSKKDFQKRCFHKTLLPRKKIYIYILWGPIDPIGTIHLEKGWAYGPIPSLRIRVYPRTIS